MVTIFDLYNSYSQMSVINSMVELFMFHIDLWIHIPWVIKLSVCLNFNFQKTLYTASISKQTNH